MPASSHPSRANLQEAIRALRPRLSTSQARVLGEMADAMLMVDSCGMTHRSSSMAELTGQPRNTLRPKYREVYDEQEAKAGGKKRGKKRREREVEEHFPDLLRGIITRWQGEKTLVLAMDASALSDRVTILSFSVASRGCAIRVAWTIVPGNQEGEWRPHGERLLGLLAEAVPADWTVSVMADRGLYAAWLFRAIVALGWHPFLRVKKGLSFRAEGEATRGTVGERVKKAGREWKGRGAWSEKGDRMEGTRVVRWEQGYEEPMCVVTDEDARTAKTAWYHLRFWIECDSKDGKRGWFHWEQTKMLKPERASRLWLVLALVMQKAILLGGALEAKEATAKKRSSKKRRVGRPTLPAKRPRAREQRVLMRGMMAWRAAETGGKKPLPSPWASMEPLPTRLSPVSRVPKSYQLKKQRREEKKRNRARAKTKSKRAERTAQKAAQKAEVQARKQARLERRAGKEARALASQPLPLVGLQEKREENRRDLEEPAKATAPQPLHTDHQFSVAMQEAPEEEPLIHRAGPLHLPSVPQPEKRVPLLRLSQGRIQPPRRPLHTKTRHQENHEAAPQAAP